MPCVQHRVNVYILQYICIILSPAFETEAWIKHLPNPLLFPTFVPLTYLAFQNKKKLVE